MTFSLPPSYTSCLQRSTEFNIHLLLKGSGNSLHSCLSGPLQEGQTAKDTVPGASVGPRGNVRLPEPRLQFDVCVLKSLYSHCKHLMKTPQSKLLAKDGWAEFIQRPNNSQTFILDGNTCLFLGNNFLVRYRGDPQPANRLFINFICRSVIWNAQ